MKSYSGPAVSLARKYGVPWLFNHPFLDNAAPWWQSVDAVGSARISSKRETSSKCVPAIPVFPISMKQPHLSPQNEALFCWFAFQSPSHAHLGAYNFWDEATRFSPGPLLPGCAPAR
jgi:hypothetical protein